MKINIIGPSCVGKTTLAKLVAKKYGWKHFDLDLVFIDRDYLAQTKIFRFRNKLDYNRRIDSILGENRKDWIIEGVYAVDKVFKEADKIILIKLPMIWPLRWQWKRYFTDSSQRDTYGLLNNIGLTKEILNQYLRKCNAIDYKDSTINYICKYCKMLKKYKSKLKIVSNIEELEELRKNGSVNKL